MAVEIERKLQESVDILQQLRKSYAVSLDRILENNFDMNEVVEQKVAFHRKQERKLDKAIKLKSFRRPGSIFRKTVHQLKRKCSPPNSKTSPPSRAYSPLETATMDDTEHINCETTATMEPEDSTDPDNPSSCEYSPPSSPPQNFWTPRFDHEGSVDSVGNRLGLQSPSMDRESTAQEVEIPVLYPCEPSTSKAHDVDEEDEEDINVSAMRSAVFEAFEEPASPSHILHSNGFREGGMGCQDSRKIQLLSPAMFLKALLEHATKLKNRVVSGVSISVQTASNVVDREAAAPVETITIKMQITQQTQKEPAMPAEEAAAENGVALDPEDLSIDEPALGVVQDNIEFAERGSDGVPAPEGNQSEKPVDAPAFTTPSDIADPWKDLIGACNATGFDTALGKIAEELQLDAPWDPKFCGSDSYHPRLPITSSSSDEASDLEEDASQDSSMVKMLVDQMIKQSGGRTAEAAQQDGTGDDGNVKDSGISSLFDETTLSDSEDHSDDESSSSDSDRPSFTASGFSDSRLDSDFSDESSDESLDDLDSDAASIIGAAMNLIPPVKTAQTRRSEETVEKPSAETASTEASTPDDVEGILCELNPNLGVASNERADEAEFVGPVPWEDKALLDSITEALGLIEIPVDADAQREPTSSWDSDKLNGRRAATDKTYDTDQSSDSDIIPSPRRRSPVKRPIVSDSDSEPRGSRTFGGLGSKRLQYSPKEKKSDESDYITVDSESDDRDSPVELDRLIPDHRKRNKPNDQQMTGPAKEKQERPKRKPFSDEDLCHASKRAEKEERKRKERLKPLDDYEDNVLDHVKEKIDGEEFTDTIAVDKNLWDQLLEHQQEGVRFLYQNVIESYEQAKRARYGGCILAHCMGLGKTIQVITFLHTIMTSRYFSDYFKTALVVCPAGLVLNWDDEVKKWMKYVPMKADRLKVWSLISADSKAERLSTLNSWKEEGGILSTSYEAYSNLVAGKGYSEADRITILEYLRDPGPDIVICDEAHGIKNPSTKRSIALAEIGTAARIALTGTPLQNDLDEYWTMVNFVKPHLLGTRQEFQKRFKQPIEAGSKKGASEEDIQEMKARTHILRETLSACLNSKGYEVLSLSEKLPEKIEVLLTVELSPLQVELYKLYTREYGIAETCQGRDKVVHLTSLQLVTFHPRCVFIEQDNEREKASRRDLQKAPENPVEETPVENVEAERREDTQEPSCKKARLWFEALLDQCRDADLSMAPKVAIIREILLQALSVGDKTLIFSDRLATFKLIEELLKKMNEENLVDSNGKPLRFKNDVNVVAISGDDPVRERQRKVKQFTVKPECYIFLISVRAGGQGLNLFAANRVILVEPAWNPAQDRQALFRAFRLGQKKPVYVYRLVAAGTHEEKLAEHALRKSLLQKRVLEEKHGQLKDVAGRDFFVYTTPQKSPIIPNGDMYKDHVMISLLEKFSNAITRVDNYDSLLAETEPHISVEEAAKGWVKFHTETGDIDDPFDPTLDVRAVLRSLNQRKDDLFYGRELTCSDIRDHGTFSLWLVKVVRDNTSLPPRRWPLRREKTERQKAEEFLKIFQQLFNKHLKDSNKVIREVCQDLRAKRDAAQAAAATSSTPSMAYSQPAGPSRPSPVYPNVVHSQRIAPARPNPAVPYGQQPAPRPGNVVNEISAREFRGLPTPVQTELRDAARRASVADVQKLSQQRNPVNLSVGRPNDHVPAPLRQIQVDGISEAPTVMLAKGPFRFQPPDFGASSAGPSGIARPVIQANENAAK